MKRAVPLLHAQVAEGNGTRIAACGAMTSSYYILGSHWTVVTVKSELSIFSEKNRVIHIKRQLNAIFSIIFEIPPWLNMAQWSTITFSHPSHPQPLGSSDAIGFSNTIGQLFGHSPRRPPTQGRPPPNFCRRFLCSCGKPITKTTSRRFLHTIDTRYFR